MITTYNKETHETTTMISESLGAVATTVTDSIPYLKGNERVVKASDNTKFDAAGANLSIKHRESY